MNLHKTLYPGNVIDRLYVKRKEERRGIDSIESEVDTGIQEVEECAKTVKTAM